jgi:hypothetical protein
MLLNLQPVGPGLSTQGSRLMQGPMLRAEHPDFVVLGIVVIRQIELAITAWRAAA